MTPPPGNTGQRHEESDRDPSERGSDSTNDPRLEIPEALRTPINRPASMRAAPKGEESVVLGMAKAWGVALDFIFTIFAGAALGWGFDRWRGTAPKGLMVGLGVGFVIAFIRIVRGTIKQERLEQEHLKRSRNGSAEGPRNGPDRR